MRRSQSLLQCFQILKKAADAASGVPCTMSWDSYRRAVVPPVV